MWRTHVNLRCGQPGHYPPTGITTGYWYAGFTDAPAGTLDANGNVTVSFIGLPRGATVTVRSSINTWSYPDLHGNYTVIANSSGVRQGNPAAYAPRGPAIPRQLLVY